MANRTWTSDTSWHLETGDNVDDVGDMGVMVEIWAGSGRGFVGGDQKQTKGYANKSLSVRLIDVVSI